MYCTILDVKNLLPPSVTVGQTNIGTPSPAPIPGRTSNSTNRDVLTPDQVITYIRYAQQDIDGRLRPFYVCPLRRVKTHETEILNNISAGNSVKIRINDSSRFAIGDTVRIQGEDDFEGATITEITDVCSVTVNHLDNNYSGNVSLLSVIKFPDPIPLITARLAVSYAFDPLFSSEQSPDVSQYGVNQRKLALNGIDGILTGTVLLFGQDHTGRRFVRGSLLDAYSSPTQDLQFGREKE